MKRQFLGRSRCKNTIRRVLTIMLMMALVWGMLPSGIAVQAEEQTSEGTLSGVTSQSESTMADASSIANWKKALTDGDGNYLIENTGKIWSDKTVTTENLEIENGGKKITVSNDGSDFLVALSALSSMSNRKTVSDKPLDIVLTLDVSGSMSDNLNGSTSKLSALKTAVNDFIDKTDAVNKNITDASKKHKIAIVKYAGNKSDKIGNTTYTSNGYKYNHTQILSNLTDDASVLKADVNALNASGCTAADYGMEYTKKIIDQIERKKSQKIVILFTDGEPNHFSGFDGYVANRAISYAKDLKKDGTRIYTIGVFDSADPSDTRNSFNAYMHGVSSNYPDAQSYQNLGNRAKDSQYYKAASNVAELNKIFDEIAQDISQSTSGVPTELGEADGSKDGYVIFTDRLGDYMKVDRFANIVCAGKTFDLKEKTTSGNKDVYHFSGTVSANALYENASLDDLIIQVEKSNDLKTGDLVTVKIPASLLPLLNFKVNEVNGKENVTVEEASPISICYGVSLKDGVEEKMAVPDENMQSYLAENQKDGIVSFYSNVYTKGEDNGDTTCIFTPASENPYYRQAKNETETKQENVTETAKNVWSSKRTSGDASEIKEELGNNGKLQVVCPGALLISKCAEVAEGFTGPEKAGETEFHFKIQIPSATNQTFQAQKYQNGQKSGNLISLTFANGKADIVLKDGESLCIYGLEANAAYSIEEVNLPGGYTLDEKSGENGKINAGKTMEAVFHNVYRADPAELANGIFCVQKQFPNWEAFQGLSFDIVLSSDQKNAPFPEGAQVTEKDGVRCMTKNVTNAQNIGFGTITFTRPGTFKYQIREQIPAENNRAGGVKYSQALYEVVVKVTDDGKGNLHAELTMWQKKDDKGAELNLAVADQIARIQNDYETDAVTLQGAANLKVKKELTGRDWMSDDAFTFAIGWDKDNPDAAKDVKLPEAITVKNGVEAHFGDIVFKEPGVYKLVIKERKGNLPGVTYADGNVKVTVVVTDNLDGTLTAKALPSGYQTEGNGVSITGDRVMTFTNRYEVKPVQTSVHGKKVLEGRDLRADDTFHFRIKAENDAPLPGETVVTNDVDGKFHFQMSYVKAGIYKYTIQEVENTEHPIPGIRYDKVKYEVTVKVTDDGKGALKAEVIYPDGNPLKIMNRYKADPVVPADFETGIRGTKQIQSSENNMFTMKGGEFTFVLETAENNPESDPVKALSEAARTVKNDADGQFCFENTMRYTESGTYVYTIREKQENANGISYDGVPVTVIVTVKDNLNGKLEATVTYEKGQKKADSILFTNKYNPDKVLVTLQGMKELTGRTLEEGTFQFRLKSISEDIPEEVQKELQNDTGKAVAENVDETVTNSQGGSFHFGELTYTHPGTYIYQVSEVQEGKAGYTYDSHVATVKVVVTDQDGILQAEVYTDGQKGKYPEFHNQYVPNPVTLEGKNIIHAKKTLHGRDMKSEEFSFELLNEDGTVVAKARNQADGNVIFSAMTYEKAGIYRYTMRETKGTSGGVTYDETVYGVTVEVTDAGGYLKAETSYAYAGDAVNIPTFSNQYQAVPVEVVPGAVKVLKGRLLAEGEFTFELKDVNGAVMQTVKNDASGRVTFDKLTFNRVGTYIYTVNEKHEQAKGITYDPSVYTYKITVTDNEQGAYQAKVETTPDEVLFTNVYTKPQEPQNPQKPTNPQKPNQPQKPVKTVTILPKTGDPAQTGLLIGIMAGAAGLAGVCVIRKRKSVR